MIDLSDIGKPQPQYLCEVCDTRLLEHTDPNRLTSGQLWICPNCGQVKDDSYDMIKQQDELGPTTSIKTPNGFIGMFDMRETDNRQEYDPDPESDAWLESQGANIIEKRIEVYDE